MVMPKGHRHTQETKEKMSLAHLNKKFTKSHRKNLSFSKLKELNPNWKYGRYITKSGYIYTLMPNHPSAVNRKGKRGYVAEHRLVMEKTLGRYLKKNEYVHHINGKKNDNRSSNLELILIGKTHLGAIICPFCKKKFNIR
jgi:hypothetical protein